MLNVFEAIDFNYNPGYYTVHKSLRFISPDYSWMEENIPLNFSE